MVNLPKRDVLYPVRDTGRQSDGRPTPEPDRHLIDIMNQYRGYGLDTIALAIQSAGYTRPTPVPTVGALAGCGPRDILSDKDGQLWSAASISNEDFEHGAPWLLERAARRPTITSE